MIYRYRASSRAHQALILLCALCLCLWCSKSNINCVAFPDDGAAKRFAHMFKPLDLEIVICGKVRL